MNKQALITGASSGIGKEFARQLHAAGYSVILVARRTPLLEALALELTSQRADSVEVLRADLVEPADLASVESYIREHAIDVLVNNAGRGSFGAFETIDLAVEEEMVRLNSIATIRLAHAALPAMRAKKSGGIISISSIAGFQPLPFMATYAATKAFNLFHSLGLWYELRNSGVTITVVCPGPTATEFGGVARVPGMVTGTARESVNTVVRQSLVAFNRGQPIVIPGKKAKLLAAASRITPVVLSTWLTGKLLLPVLRATDKK